MSDETSDTTWPPCPDCRADEDERCEDWCPRIAGQTGLTFDGTQTPVAWVPPRAWEVQDTMESAYE